MVPPQWRLVSISSLLKQIRIVSIYSLVSIPPEIAFDFCIFKYMQIVPKIIQIHSYITSHHITSHHITSHYITTLHYITLHYITLHHITLHYITSHYITLHYIMIISTLFFNRTLRKKTACTIRTYCR